MRIPVVRTALGAKQHGHGSQLASADQRHTSVWCGKCGGWFLPVTVNNLYRAVSVDKQLRRLERKHIQQEIARLRGLLEQTKSEQEGQ